MGPEGMSKPEAGDTAYSANKHSGSSDLLCSMTLYPPTSQVVRILYPHCHTRRCPLPRESCESDQKCHVRLFLYTHPPRFPHLELYFPVYTDLLTFSNMILNEMHLLTFGNSAESTFSFIFWEPLLEELSLLGISTQL